MTELYGSMGKPILHSISPQMHNSVFTKLGIDAKYIRIAAESKEDGLEMAKRLGMRGMNITAPFKDIIEIVDTVDPSAKKVGAVNTVVLKDGKATGYNTDVQGVAGGFIGNGVELKGKRALVLGAGGAAKAAAVAMLENGAKVTITNRTLEKAEALADELGAESCPLDGLGDAVPGCQLIVGCLSTAERVMPKELLRSDMTIMDAYYQAETALMKDGKEAGCKVIDGREWLLYQGIACSELFTGKTAPVEVIRDAIYSAEKEAKNNIALIGFMGSGKNSVSNQIHNNTGMPVLDIDSEIEKKAGMAIADIFAKKGEEEFRRMEKEEIAALREHKGKAVNCGGGAVLDEENRKMLKDNAVVVWLWADAGSVLARVPKDGSRPLLNVPDPEKRIEELLEERKAAYADACDMILNTVGKTPAQIAERILYERDKAFPDIR